jgi:hypothetical protein
MSLWGNKDSKTASGTIAIDADGVVAGSSTAFTTESRIGDFIRVSNEDYRITDIASDTAATVVAGVVGATLTAVNAGASYTLSEKPKYVSDPTKVFGVDATEAVSGGDNVVSIAVASGGLRYLETPAVTLTAPVSLTIPTTAVSTADDTITSANHRLLTGTKLTYLKVGATAITGLVDGTAYFIIVVDGDTFKLASSLSNAQAGTAINLTGTGSSTQTFTGDTATGTATISGGLVTAVAVTDSGSAYTSAPTVVVNKPRRTIPTSGVTIATEQIAYATHGLVAAESVKYFHAGSTAITGLSNDTEYFVSALGFAAGTFRLATTAEAAAGRTALAGVAISGTGGEFTCTATTLAVGDRIRITGTLGGTGTITSYATGNIYTVSAITGTSPSVTGFTLTTEAGSALTTTSGTPTGLTYTPFTIVLISGTGNNNQYFEIQASTNQATAISSLGDSSTSGTAHAGWVVRTVGTGGRAGRVNYETLVAMGTITGDQADDTEFKDS